MIIFFFMTGVSLNTFSQSIFDAVHVYGLGSDYYYLDLKSNGKFKIKVGMYDNDVIKGEFKITKDKLHFTKIIQRKKTTDIDWIKERFSNFEIIDSLLIPKYYSDGLSVPEAFIPKSDSIVNEFIQTDYHAHYSLTFNKDSSFIFRYGIAPQTIEEKGSWVKIENIIELTPNKADNYINWITTNNKLVDLNNFIVGLTHNDKKDKELIYLIKIKTRR